MGDSDSRASRAAGADTGTFVPEEPASELVPILDRYMADLQEGRAPDRARLNLPGCGLGRRSMLSDLAKKFPQTEAGTKAARTVDLLLLESQVKRSAPPPP